MSIKEEVVYGQQSTLCKQKASNFVSKTNKKLKIPLLLQRSGQPTIFHCYYKDQANEHNFVTRQSCINNTWNPAPPLSAVMLIQLNNFRNSRQLLLGCFKTVQIWQYVTQISRFSRLHIKAATATPVIYHYIVNWPLWTDTQQTSSPSGEMNGSRLRWSIPLYWMTLATRIRSCYELYACVFRK